MKLQPAMIFGEHMLLKQNTIIPIWGRSANDDLISVTLNGATKTTVAINGEWFVEFEPMMATEKTTLIISSKKTDEVITINDVAIGEVVLAGGQSNMEFLMKYDFDFEEIKACKKDHNLRFFCYPQTSFPGFIEKEPLGDWGYWRTFEEDEDKGMFSAVGAYLGMKLREELNVPVGIISCNWGGTPATAWISLEDIKANFKLKPVLDWQKKANENTKWETYIETAYERMPIQTPEQKAFMDKFMMGEDMTEFFKAGPPKINTEIYSQYLPGPLSCIKPASLYENMLCKIAPYPISFIMWWQGEDDDARDWQDFYDESMRTLIKCWRKLWNKKLPFFQVELATFRGIGVTAAKKYPLLRHKQYDAIANLEDAYNVCSLDIGEEYNIHPRHKKNVGLRLANMALKYVYQKDINADCPRFKRATKNNNEIIIEFDYTFGKLIINDKLKDNLFVKDNDNIIDYSYRVDEDKLVLIVDSNNRLTIEYCESNYCECAIYNLENNPAFGFTTEV